FFFFQAEDGIRDFHVTGVQTCALPIFNTSDLGVAKPDPEVFRLIMDRVGVEAPASMFVDDHPENVQSAAALGMRAHLYKDAASRSEERRVGKGRRCAGALVP